MLARDRKARPPRDRSAYRYHGGVVGRPQVSRYRFGPGLVPGQPVPYMAFARVPRMVYDRLVEEIGPKMLGVVGNANKRRKNSVSEAESILLALNRLAGRGGSSSEAVGLGVLRAELKLCFQTLILLWVLKCSTFRFPCSRTLFELCSSISNFVLGLAVSSR